MRKEIENEFRNDLNKITTEKVIKVLNDLQYQKVSLQTQIDLGIISISDAVIELEMISKKDISIRKQYVLSVHVTKDGNPRSISHHKPTDLNGKDYYSTKLPTGKKIKATTYDGLIVKLSDYYSCGGTCDYSLRSIFKAALAEKGVTENPNPNTLLKLENDFERFISNEFASSDIRKVQDMDIMKYTQKFVNAIHPKKAAFLSYKGVLNLIFKYARRHHIIMVDPLADFNNRPYMKSCDTSKARPEEKILLPEEIQMLKDEIRHRMTLKKYGTYYINGFACLFAIETGVRAGELCSLKWSDVKENCIHIHSQQLYQKQEGGKNYYQASYTKNEKGVSSDGRDFPLTKKIKELLNELKSLQTDMGIESEYIFCHEDGDWIKTDAYETFLRRICLSLGFKVTNNHALRMSLNSNVLIPLGVTVADRAAMLGHSIQTNLEHYSFAQKNYVSTVCALLDAQT